MPRTITNSTRNKRMLKMKIKIEVNKSLEQNAGIYYNKAKKARKKLKGAKEALEKSYLKLEKAKSC